MKNCHCCGSDRYRIIKNYDQHSSKFFDVRVCDNCGSGQTEFDFINDSLAHYYPKTYFGTKSRRFFALIEWIIAFSRRKRAKYLLNQAHSKAARVLDVGCGRGLMLSYLYDQGYDVYGTEFSVESAENAALNLGDRIRVGKGLEGLSFSESYFDIISYWHVLEHLDSPIEYLRKTKSILNTSGRLVVEVPNFGSFQALISPGRWIYCESPRHLFHFTPKGLKLLLQRSGFEVQGKIETVSYEYGFIGMLQSMLNLVSFTPNFFYYFLKKDRFEILNFRLLKSWFDLLVMLFFVPLFLPVAFVLEITSWVFKRGSIIRLVAAPRAKV